jgi:RND superfamily putative drug exporter
VGGSTFGKLSSVQENDAAVFLPESAESTRAAEYHRQFIPDPAVPGLFVVGGIESDADIAAVREFADAVVATSLPEDPQGRTVGDVLAGPPAVVPSGDGKAVLVTFLIPAADYATPVGEGTVGELVAEAIKETWTEQETGLDGYLTGAVGFVADLVAAFAGIDGVLLIVALTVVLIILLVVYRSPVLPLLVLVTAMIALTAAIVVVYELAKNDVITLNGQAQGIMFILVVGATTDYALLLVARYREELRLNESPYTALWLAWRRSLEPIAASAGTVIAGLLVLLLSELKSLQALGPAGAVGITASLLAALTLLPALLLIGGEKARIVFWPRKPLWRGATASSDDDSVEAVELRSGRWGQVSRAVSARPRTTWTAATALLLGLAALLSMLNLGGLGDRDYFLTQVDSERGYDLLEAHFAAGASSPIRVIIPEKDLERTLQEVQGVSGIVAAYPLTASIAAGGPPSLSAEPPIVAGGRVEVLGITQVPASSAEAADIVADVRSVVHQVSPNGLVGGQAAEALDTRLTTERDAKLVIPIVLAVILLVLILLLRAIVAPVLIVLANVLSFAAALGLSAIVFDVIFGFPGVDAGTVLLAFVFLVALGVDYSIFLTSRAREESLAHGTREGVRRALAVTGGVITSAGIVLAATFAALGVIPLIFLAQIAFIVAAGVLIDTFIVRSLLVPGLMIDMGKRVWAPWQKAFKD